MGINRVYSVCKPCGAIVTIGWDGLVLAIRLRYWGTLRSLKKKDMHLKCGGRVLYFTFGSQLLSAFWVRGLPEKKLAGMVIGCFQVPNPKNRHILTCH